MRSIVQGLVAAANQDLRLVRLNIDRDKAQSVGPFIGEVFSTLQAALGGYFIYNFNLFGRSWQANLRG